MADKYILDKINEKPAAFFKKLRGNWFNPLIYSTVHLDWYVREEGYRIEEINIASKYYPSISAEIAQFIVALETWYSDEKFDYKNETYVSAGIKLYKAYRERFIKYLNNKVEDWEIDQIRDELDPEAIFKELVYRGYIPFDYLKAKPKQYYLIAQSPSGSIKLIYPHYFKDFGEATKGFERFGLPGITSISQNP